MESINTTYSSYIQPNMGEISINITKPWKHNTDAMADTGANMNAISLTIAETLYKKYIKTERRSFRVRTGGGYISCQDFITLSIQSDSGILHNIKFYIIPELPFDYIIGRPLLQELGYQLTKINPTITTQYHHHPDNIDCLADEDIVHSPSPLPPKTHTQQPILQKTKIAKRDETLTKFIQNALKDHTNICAQSEFDIGRIPNSEFKIEFKNGVETTPIRCAEYPHNIKDVAEIERQLRLMIAMGLISRSDSPWRFPTFIVPKKNGEARIVFDYRKLNAITKRMAYSLPSIPSLKSKFKGKTWISTIYVKSGYWHIPFDYKIDQKQPLSSTVKSTNGMLCHSDPQMLHAFPKGDG